MALLEIKKAGDTVLKEICQPVAKIDNKIRRLLDDMAETMYEANGVGLAAPQVGTAIRVVVIDVGNGLLELINPVIVEREGTDTDTEGCLSIPDIFGEVERSSKVTVEFTNRRNKKQQITGEGLLARCFQHELDHLDGVLFIDRALSIQRGESK
ncbi:peptide deformylase [Propionispira arboris]|uniref:Peptide deformylase n=1 Tax=Propionispira arboris TaxID=84035 RepID=A0A1H6W3F5_9FIRM|nr:peptide deformylase [Propionispira arboris]SEJ11443.1 peptide deformylase [Propionispira arboris]